MDERPYDRLFVLWNEPDDRGRHVIGILAREGGEYVFSYEPGVGAALQRGFRLPPEFPERRSSRYRSRYLFSTFAQRVPAPTRPDRKEILRSWGVAESDDLLEILALSGGLQTTDRIELSEYRSYDDPLARPLIFRVAGEQHHPPVPLSSGDRVILRREPGNPHDEHATLVLLKEGVPVGYVPRQYSPLIASHLDARHSLETVVERRLMVPADRGRWVLSTRRADAPV